MGCNASKKKLPANAKDSEQTFVGMDKKTVYTNKNDVVASHKDFVVEYQDMQVFYENYEVHKDVIGTGAFGKVKRAKKRSNGEERAVKIIDKLALDKAERVRLKYEIDILKNLNHPNIVRLYEIYENKSSIYIVTELCDGCELFEEIQSRQTFTENEAAHVTKQILQAIAYCHSNNVSHRDLKPENILIDINNKGAIKVIDFGTSHHYNEEDHVMHQMYGTPYYIAPEVLDGNYTEKCDLWSIGVMLYIMLCGSPPINAQSDRQIIAKVRRGVWTFDGPIWNEISAEAKELVSQLMNKNVAERLSAKEALDHPWIKARVRKTFNERVAKNAISSLSKFNSESKLKQATLTFMASHLATKRQLKELRISFDQFDENGDGLIQRQEFLRAYRRLHPKLNQGEVDERANEIFNRADVDGNGEIDFGEWCTATINQQELLNEPNMQAAFRLFDKDNGGTIDANEIGSILGHNNSQEQGVWTEIVREVDLNGDGQIDFEEFKVMLKKFAERQDAAPSDGPTDQVEQNRA